MLILLTTIHTIICLFLILVVLLQQGKGADLSVFGGGSTQAVFGARGAATLLHKLTVAGFVGFILTTIGIGLMGAGSSRGSVMSTVPPVAAVEEPAPATETGAAVEAQPSAEADTMPAEGDAGTTATADEGAGANDAEATPPDSQ